MYQGQISGMLSDNDIKRYFGSEIKIYTEDKNGDFKFDLEKQLQLASIDLRFRNECKRFKNGLTCNLTYEMLKNHEYTDPFEISNTEKLVIIPGEVIFTTTLETVMISNDFAGIITGRSSIARLGIMVHCCQEFINPGQGAPIALQITNLGKYPVELDMRIPICQLVLFKLSSPSSDSYSQREASKYKNEKEPMSSRIFEENPPAKESRKIKTIYTQTYQILKKYISPFLPSVIMLLLITPLFTSLKAVTITALLSNFLGTPITNIFLVLCIVLFFYLRKGE